MATLVNCRRDDNVDEALFMFQGRFASVDLKKKSLVLAPNQMPPLNFTNNLGALLLPSNLTYQHLSQIQLHCHKPTIVTYDAMGRVHLLILSSYYYIIMDKLWEPVQLIESVAEIKGIDHAKHTIDSDLSMYHKLLLPPDRPNDFLNWHPHGQYSVLYDKQGRVFRMTNANDDVQLNELWESRFPENLLMPKSINTDDDMI